MDDSNGEQKKSVKQPSHKIKDLYNTYVRNEGTRSIPVNSPEKVIEPADENIEQNFEIENLINEIKELKAKTDELNQEKEELKDRLIRTIAEFENYKKRSIREKQELIDYANEKLILRLLPVLDDLSNAVESGKKTNDFEALLTGMEMILQKWNKTMEENGVIPVTNPVGKPFDVDFHEAMMRIPSEFPEDTVVHELQQGYMLNGRVLRHSKVVTSAGENQDDSADIDYNKEK